MICVGKVQSQEVWAMIAVRTQERFSVNAHAESHMKTVRGSRGLGEATNISSQVQHKRNLVTAKLSRGLVDSGLPDFHLYLCVGTTELGSNRMGRIVQELGSIQIWFRYISTLRD